MSKDKEKGDKVLVSSRGDKEGVLIVGFEKGKVDANSKLFLVSISRFTALLHMNSTYNNVIHCHIYIGVKR